MNNGWTGVDLDATLAHYDGWQGELHIGEPIPEMVARVKEWISEGHEVRIFTARVHEEVPGKRQACRTAIEDWCEKHIGKRLRVTNTKDFGMIALWDDRAVQVIPNTGRRVAVNP